MKITFGAYIALHCHVGLPNILMSKKILQIYFHY
jgi:hypothetical protein